MKKKLQVINIDGTEGSGKSTQISHLAGYFRTKGLKVQVNRLENSLESGIECAEKTKGFLEENPNGLVINDGSMARMIVSDLVRGGSQKEVVEKYRDIIHLSEIQHHAYGTANILLVMEDLDECNNRYKKEAEVLQKSSYKAINIKTENNVVNGLKAFDNNIINQNMDFWVLNLDKEDRILEIKDTLIDYLNKKFQI